MEDLKYIEDSIKNATHHLTKPVKAMCCARKRNGEQCSNAASINDKLCKKHKHFVLNERTIQKIVYHNHLPSISFCKNCPRCLISYSDYQVSSP